MSVSLQVSIYCVWHTCSSFDWPRNVVEEGFENYITRNGGYSNLVGQESDDKETKQKVGPGDGPTRQGYNCLLLFTFTFTFTQLQFNSIQARSVRPDQIMSENDAPKISAIGADDPFL